MEWDALFNYLGTGGGLIVLLNWIANLPLLRKKRKMEKDDVSRLMAEKDNQTILELYDQMREFRAGLFRLEGILERLVDCPYFGRCPARVLVQDYKRKRHYKETGQPRVGSKRKRYPRDNPIQPGDIADIDGQPP